MNRLKHCFSIGEAIANLFYPLVEVVIHDTKTDSIIFIKGSLSKRKIGDRSLLEADLEDINLSTYTKINYDGRLIKSISIPIKNQKDVIAIMCINYDISLLKNLNEITNIVTNPQLSRTPESLFKNDWQSKINELVASELKNNNLQFCNLKNKDKKTIIHRLFQLGAFSEKNAANYIAKIMSMGRATVFNYLREFKENNNAF